MCGIAAIITADPLRLEKVRGMVTAQRDRGPDHDDVWIRSGAALGHTRLSLLDLEATGDQPMALGQMVISFNGEIYNHQALRKQHLKGEKIASTSDTATLLHLIARYGVAMTLPMLRGMYAFAVWDEGARRLTMATDPLGIKPLYVTHGKGEFACASSTAALLGLRTRWNIDPGAMARFFRLGGTDGAWEGIERVHGGRMLVYDAATDRLKRSTWYEPEFHADAAERMDHAITEAMDLVQLADVPVGIFLSGGVDSSVAAGRCKRGVSPAFHLDSAEREHAEIVARHYGLPFHVVEADQDSIIAAHRDIAAKCGEPTMAGHIPWIVARFAHEHCKAAISANGADELFFGYDRTPHDRSIAARLKQDEHLFRRHDAFNAACGPGDWTCRPLDDPGFPDDATGRWRELQYYVQHDLNPTLDAASMCFGLEMRVPYLDHVLVELALSLPHSWHGNKRVLRERLLRDGIPATTVDHTKLGFSMAANSATVKQYINNGLAWMKSKHGLTINPKASGRDKSYLGVCAMAWMLWEQQWETRIQR